MSELPGQDASMTTLPRPSWQRDPLGRYEYRFWDGTQWSDHVATGGIQGIDPLPHAPVSGSDPKTQQFSNHHPSKRQIAKQGRNQFENLAIKAAHGDTDAVQALPAAATQAREYYRNDKKYLDEAWAVMTVALRDVLTDDVLTEQGDTHIAKLASALGIHPADLAHRNFALWEEVMVARINDGRPLPDDRGPLITQPGETAYGPTFAVALMKEVVDRQLRGGSSGVSVRIAKGVYYRVGQVRAHSVVVGTHLEAQDSGHLVVTDRRAVFMGTKKTLEFRRDRLVGLQQYADGLRLSVSNRQTASLFRFAPGSSPTIAAAMLSRT
jgi:hypothetical protein